MNIIAKINPLYTDLLSLGYEKLLSDPGFNRVTNALNLTELFADSHNEAMEAKRKDPYAIFLSDNETEKEILGLLLNKMFDKPLPEFAESLTSLLEATIPQLPYVSNVDSIKKDLASLNIGYSFQDRIHHTWQIADCDYNKKATYLYNLVRTRARNSTTVNEKHYQLLRVDIIKHHKLKNLVPGYINEHVYLDGFWQFIKGQGGYREREAFIDETFEPLLEAAKSILNVAQENLFVENIPHVDLAFINEDWRKALNRLKEDPAAAITSARSLVETVCKYILDALMVTYDEGADLPSLYRLTAKQLQLSPEAHTEAIFKQILTGCFNIVTGLGSLRNKHSDAHGKRITNVKPSARHAELAVNISGAVCSFLLQTYEFRQSAQVTK